MFGKVTILSIDGGGIRGIIPAVIVAYIEAELRRKTGNLNAAIADYFDLVAGTSAGGMLACYYLLPPEPHQNSHSRYSAAEAVDIFAKHGKEIFNRKRSRKGYLREKYPADGLEKVLKDFMGDKTLADSRKHCLVTAYDMTRRESVFFTSPEARARTEKNYLLRDVARATSAAPTYFEPARIHPAEGEPRHLIDGAMLAGNPAICAMVEANKSQYDSGRDHPAITDLYMVSIGTGQDKKAYSYSDLKNKGALKWVEPIISMMLSTSVEVVDYQLSNLFATAGCSDCCIRLEPALGKAKPDMDDASEANIKNLKAAGESFVRDNKQKLDKTVDDLLRNSAGKTT